MFWRKHLFEIYVPKNSNDGLEYALSHHHAWDAEVGKIAGGLTVLKSVKGQWTSDYGELFREPMIPVRIMCTKRQIKDIAELTARHYDQQAVFHFRAGTHPTIYYPKAKQ